MFGVQKKTLRFDLEEKRVHFDGFALGGKKRLGTLIAGRSKNCDCTKGYLSAGLGVYEYLLSGEAFITPVRVRKPRGVGLTILGIIGLCEFGFMLWLLLR